MNGRTSQKLQALLDEYLNQDDIRDLAFSLHIDFDNLKGETKRGRIISLLEQVQMQRLQDEFVALVVEKRPHLRDQLAGPIFQELTAPAATIDQENDGRIFVWLAGLAALILIIFVVVQLWPNSTSPTGEDPSADRFLLQVQVTHAEDQSPIFNAEVRLTYEGGLVPTERTDSNGRAVFSLPIEAVGELARLVVSFEGYETKSQNITLDDRASVVEFQIRPLP